MTRLQRIALALARTDVVYDKRTLHLLNTAWWLEYFKEHDNETALAHNHLAENSS